MKLKKFFAMECDCVKSFCVVVGIARAEFCKKNDKRKRGGAGVVVGHCSRIIHHSICTAHYKQCRRIRV